MDRVIETDNDHCWDLGHGRSRSVQPPGVPKKGDSFLDERIDSGFDSSEISCFSVEEEEEKNIDLKKDCPDKHPGHGHFDLSNHISKLSIDNSDRFDSGISEETQQSSETGSTEWFSRSLSSSKFSPHQIIEIFKGDEDGDSHLHLSIIHGSDEITNRIIRLAPDAEWVNQANNLLQTPLHLAVITRQASVVRRLMCAGASVDARDENGNTPLHNACRLGFEDVVRTLLSPVLFEETYQNEYQIPHQRIPQDLDSRNYEGLTCLHLAAISGHIHVMRLLLGSGACVNTPEGKSGRTVLHMAADWGHIEMLKFLLQRREINIDADTYAGLTPIILAFGRNHVDAVDVLYKSGASYDIGSLNDDSDMESSDDEMSESASFRPSSATSYQAYMQTCH